MFYNGNKKKITAINILTSSEKAYVPWYSLVLSGGDVVCVPDDLSGIVGGGISIIGSDRDRLGDEICGNERLCEELWLRTGDVAGLREELHLSRVLGGCQKLWGRGEGN